MKLFTEESENSVKTPEVSKEKKCYPAWTPSSRRDAKNTCLVRNGEWTWSDPFGDDSVRSWISFIRSKSSSAVHMFLSRPAAPDKQLKGNRRQSIMHNRLVLQGACLPNCCDPLPRPAAFSAGLDCMQEHLVRGWLSCCYILTFLLPHVLGTHIPQCVSDRIR